MGELSLFRAIYFLILHFYFTKNVAQEVHVVIPIAGNREVFKIMQSPYCFGFGLTVAGFLIGFYFCSSLLCENEEMPP